MQVNIHRMSSANKQPSEGRDVPVQERRLEGNPNNTHYWWLEKLFILPSFQSTFQLLHALIMEL